MVALVCGIVGRIDVVIVDGVDVGVHVQIQTAVIKQ